MPHSPFPPTPPRLFERFLRGVAPQTPYKERGRPLTPVSSGFGFTLDPRSAIRLLWKTLALALLSLLLVSKTSESKPTKDSTPPRYLLHPASLAKRGIDLPFALLPSVKAQDLARTLSLEVSGSQISINGQTPFKDSFSGFSERSELRQRLQERQTALRTYVSLQQKNLAGLSLESLRQRSCRDLAIPLTSNRTIRLALDQATSFRKFTGLLQDAMREGFDDIFLATCRQGVEPCRVEYSSVFRPVLLERTLDEEALCGWPSPDETAQTHLHVGCWDDGSWRFLGKAAKKDRDGLWHTWSPQGQKLCQGSFVKGQKHGTFSLWYPDGRNLASLPYREGELHGLSILWHKNGKIRATLFFHEGKRHGVSRFFDAQGRKLAVFSFAHDQLRSAELWYLNAKKQAEFSFVGDSRHGRWMQWYPDGTTMWERTYSQGHLTSSRRWHPRGKLAHEAAYHPSKASPGGQATSIKLWNAQGLPCGAWMQRQQTPPRWKRDIHLPCSAFPRLSFTPKMQALANATQPTKLVEWLEPHLPRDHGIVRPVSLSAYGGSGSSFSGLGLRSPLGSLGEREPQRDFFFGEIFSYGALDRADFSEGKALRKALEEGLADRLSCAESLPTQTPIHLELFFQIEEDGRISEIRVERMVPPHPNFEDCLVKGLSLRSLPSSDGGITHLFLPLWLAFEKPKADPPKHDPRNDQAVYLPRSSATRPSTQAALPPPLPSALPEEEDPRPPLSFRLLVLIDENGFTPQLQGSKLSSCDRSPSSAPAKPLSFPKKGHQFDHASLTRCLSQIKARFPQEKQVTLAAPSDLPFRDLIQTLQAIQQTPQGSELFPLVSLSLRSL